MGSKDARADKADETIFGLYSRGLATGKDAYIYNFSRDTCAQNALRMTQSYLHALQELKENPELTVEEVVQKHTSGIKWDRELENNLRRKKKPQFDYEYTRKVTYRPFVATNCYADYIFVQMKYQLDRIFPDSSSENRVICVPGLGSKKAFSALITDTMPDLGFNEASQCFPRYRYLEPVDVLGHNWN